MLVSGWKSQPFGLGNFFFFLLVLSLFLKGFGDFNLDDYRLQIFVANRIAKKHIMMYIGVYTSLKNPSKSLWLKLKIILDNWPALRCGSCQFFLEHKKNVQILLFFCGKSFLTIWGLTQCARLTLRVQKQLGQPIKI